jgi:hypothetical protein
MGSDAMIIKIGLDIQKLTGGIHTHMGNMVIAQAYFLFILNKGSRVKISHLSDLPHLTIHCGRGKTHQW